MAELHADGQAAPWLEMELSRQLGPVRAPEALWDRIEGYRTPEAGGSFQWMSWPVAAALMLTIAGGGVAWHVAVPRSAASGDRALAVEELRRLTGGGRLEFRSDDPAEIRVWAKAMANVDIDLPAQIPAGRGGIKLLGAQVIERKGTPVAAVAYRVGDGTATMLVSGKHSADGDSGKPAHVFSPVVTTENARVLSWKTREQEYTIASSATGDPQLACHLCHAQAQMTVN